MWEKSIPRRKIELEEEKPLVHYFLNSQERRQRRKNAVNSGHFALPATPEGSACI